jgi:hypothetical protein
MLAPDFGGAKVGLYREKPNTEGSQGLAGAAISLVCTTLSIRFLRFDWVVETANREMRKFMVMESLKQEGSAGGERGICGLMPDGVC